MLDAVDRRDVRMVQRRENARFPFEPREASRIVRQCARQKLDGDLTPELRVPRAVDLAHAAGAERADHFEIAEAVAGLELRSRGNAVGVEIDRGTLEKSVARSMSGEQRFDLAP